MIFNDNFCEFVYKILKNNFNMDKYEIDNDLLSYLIKTFYGINCINNNYLHFFKNLLFVKKYITLKDNSIIIHNKILNDYNILYNENKEFILGVDDLFNNSLKLINLHEEIHKTTNKLSNYVFTHNFEPAHNFEPPQKKMKNFKNILSSIKKIKSKVGNKMVNKPINEINIDNNFFKQDETSNSSMKNFDNIENDGTLFYDNITKNIFVKSENNENVHYIVNENLKCSCPAFKYCKNKKNPMCKHLKKVINSKELKDTLLKYKNYSLLKKIKEMKNISNISENDNSDIIKVQSMTNKKIYYYINLKEKTCTCPSFKFCKKKVKTCKHLQKFKFMLKT